MISDLCDRGDCETCFEDELDACGHECHPTDSLAGVITPTTEQPSTGGARQAPDPADGLPRSVRVAQATVPGEPAVRGAPHGTAGGKTSPQRRERASAAGIPGPSTGADSPLLESAPVRARVQAPAPDTRAVPDRVAAQVRVPGKTPAGASGTDSPPAGSRALAVMAAAMSEADLLSNVTAGTRKRPGLCKLYGLTWYHTHNSKRSPSGFPDLVIAGRKVLYRELKRQKENPTKAQREWIAALKAAGADVDVWRPEDWYSGRINRELAALAGLRTGAA